MEKDDLLFQENESNLRPQRLTEYIGQENIKEMLNVFIQTALMRGECLDHVLLYGPPGLGKTTLAHIIANEMGANIKTVTAPSIKRVGDLAAILASLEAGDILFIDEIHRLPKVVEEVLYSAMEDYVIDIIVGKDATASTIQIELPPFTLIGATTRCGDISAPLRDRFGIVNQINYYNVDELTTIVMRTSGVYNFSIAKDAAVEIARRSRGTPRVANRLFRRVRDFAQFAEDDCTEIKLPITITSLNKLKIDHAGLNETDYQYLRAIIEKFKGGPVGLNAIAASIGEEQTTLEDVYEPYLLQEGFIVRTPRGRMATQKAYEHLQIKLI
ncbi:MAG TPA: Holliday junction branch migration DNA helicase RuvB [Acholeplasmataceae bacterium]|nr:Holliday junction branch migration DNA helicase RuvB [Acholeplasmataceae bacterium]